MNRLVTIALFAYNSEKYIAEAIEGVLSQDYTPLEVILSDDASTDATFTIIQQYAAQYIGPHKIIVRKNQINQGLCQHINTVWSLVSGEWLVVAAGDDISLSNRVSKIMSEVEIEPKLKLLTTYAENIDSNGNRLGIDYVGDLEKSPLRHSTKQWDIRERIKNTAPLTHGATFAYSREIIDLFPRLPSECIYEDNIIGFRAEILGKCALIRIPLIQYRLHENQKTQTTEGNARLNDVKRVRNLSDGVVTVMQNIKDFQFVKKNRLKNVEVHQIEKWLDNKLTYFSNIKKSLCYIWPIRIIPFVSLILSKQKYVPLTLDLTLRVMLPVRLYFLLKNKF